MIQKEVVLDGGSLRGYSSAAGIEANSTMNAATFPRSEGSREYCSGSINQPATGVAFIPSVQVTCGNSEQYSQGQANIRSNIQLNEISILLPAFNGESNEDVEYFVKTIEYTKQVFGINDDIMKLFLMKQLEGKARLWMLSSSDLVWKSYSEVLEDLRHTFEVIESSFELRKTLASIKWNGYQSFKKYCFEKKLVAQKLKIPEKELIDYVIEGIEN